MRIPLTAGLCLLCVPALFASPDIPALQAQTPAAWLSSVFGPAGLESLKSRGYVILQGKPGSTRLQKASWKSLESLAKHAPAAVAFCEALPRLQAGQALAPAGPLSWLSLRELPPTGLMTPSLHMLVETMAAYHESWLELTPADPDSKVPPPELAAPTLFDSDWSQPFADRIENEFPRDPAPVLSAYADFLLTGARNSPQAPASLAAAHFIGYFQNRYQVDVSSRLAADMRAGAPSAELREHLQNYLAQQRLLHGLRRLIEQERSLAKRTNLLQDLGDLAAVAAVLRSRPALLAELESAVQAAPAGSGMPELTGTSLHLQKPAALGQHELGDAVTVSGAYWVDGLPPQTKIEVEETTYLEDPDGFISVQSRAVKRPNGGPYAFERRILLTDSAPFVFHAAISASSGNVLQANLQVPVAKDFELALLQLAQAEDLSLACDFEAAQSSYSKLETAIAEAAREKPQYAELLETALKRHSEASRHAAILAQLQESAAVALQDSSPDQCRYDLKRVEQALSLARSLPAGCDRTRLDLSRRRQIIARRAADQQAFSRAADLATSRRRACDFSLASQGFAEALAILDADPEARCGEIAKAAATAQEELTTSRTQELWRSAFSEDLRQAETEPTSAKRLTILEPMIARIGWLPQSDCFSSELKKAEGLAQDAGTALSMPDALAAKASADTQVSAIAAEVSAQRRKLTADATTLEHKKAAEQSPTASAPPQRPTGGSQ